MFWTVGVIVLPRKLPLFHCDLFCKIQELYKSKLYRFSDRLVNHTAELHVRKRYVLLQDLESFCGAMRLAVTHARSLAVRLPGKPEIFAGVWRDRGRS